MKRLQWIDAARGIGILAVVWGHTVPGLVRTSIYTWHMPFFFLLSGFVYRTQGTFVDYARHRARQLLIPYALWMAIVMFPSLVVELRQHNLGALSHRLYVVLFGGYELAGPTTAYWFITSLYLGLVLYDALCRLSGGRWTTAVCVVCYVLSCLRSAFLRDWIFFWEADAVLLALPLIHLGRTARSCDWTEKRSVLYAGCAVFAGVALLLALGVPVPAYDMKSGNYGLPWASLGLALAGSLFVVLLAKSIKFFAGALAYIGRASLLIVLTHTTLASYFLRSSHRTPPLVQFVVCVMVPLVLFALLSRWGLARRYLLNEIPKSIPNEPSPRAEDARRV